MSARRWLAVVLGLLVIGGVVAVYRLPELVRRVAIARLQALTQRPVGIDRVELDLLRGRASLQGFRLAERDGRTPFAEVARLDVGVRPLALLRGHLHIREVAVSGSTVHVVRLPDGTFNFSDLVESEGSGGRALDLTVDRLALTGGTVTLEDRGLPEPRTWISERIVRTPGGGDLRLTGRVGLDPRAADVRVVARDVALSPYRPYLPTPALVAGTADLDVALVVPSLADGRATARGRAGLSRVDVRDGERTVMRVERAIATGVDVDWPGRIAVDRLALAQPWVLVERDERGGLPLRALLTARPGADRASAASSVDCGAGPCPSPGSTGGDPVAVSVAHLSVEGGGLRVVDHGVSPPFAVDLQSATLKMEGLSTTAAKPARLELRGRLGPGAELALRGTVGALGRPLRLDVNGELREFALPRTNPYLLKQVGWKTADGRLTSKLQCRIDGDALSARTDIRLSRLQLVRAGEHDGAQARIGLPLGVITALMKNSRGDINVSLPVGGRLGDPRFDFREAVWGAVRAVAINAITLPVSWIGRVRFTGDSRIERIEINPVPFEPGTASLTAEGRAQVTRLAAFLEQLPEVRLALTPVVSSRDLDALRRRTVEEAIERTARQHGLSREAAAARLLAERVADRPGPERPEATVAALMELAPVPPTEIGALADRRLQAVRGTLEQSGIDGKRVPERKLVQQEGRASQVDADVLEPETPRPSKVREVLRRLGVPLKEGGAER
jgi:hypothetical protein